MKKLFLNNEQIKEVLESLSIHKAKIKDELKANAERFKPVVVDIVEERAALIDQIIFYLRDIRGDDL